MTMERIKNAPTHAINDNEKKNEEKSDKKKEKKGSRRESKRATESSKHDTGGKSNFLRKLYTSGNLREEDRSSRRSLLSESISSLFEKATSPPQSPPHFSSNTNTNPPIPHIQKQDISLPDRHESLHDTLQYWGDYLYFREQEAPK